MKAPTFVLAVCCLLAPLASAQPKVVEGRRALAFREIERGLFVEARGGFWSTVNPPAAQGSAQYFSPGMAAQLDVGLDVGEQMSVSLFVLAANNTMKSDYTGLSEGGKYSGDFSQLVPGAQVVLRVLGFDDGQEVKRTWIYLRAGAGVVFYTPKNLLPRLDVLVSAGPGIEYFTHLRHFSIGLEANLQFMALTQSFGFSVLPAVKYAF